MVTRDDLDRKLNALQKELARRVADEPDDQGLLPWINAEHDRLIATAAPEDKEYVRSQIDCMEAFEGLIPGDDSRDQCRPGAPASSQ